MKKIVGAIAMVALVAGVAFADVNISMNYRTRAAMFDFTSVDDGDYTTTYLDWFKMAGYAASQDNVGFKVDTEKAGVQLTIMPSAQKDSSPLINTYNAYVKFGDLKVAAGFWKDGFADGAYRVKKDHDAANTEGVDAEVMKLGSGFKGVGSQFVDNVVGPEGGDQKNVAAYAEYGLAINDDMKLNLLAGMVTNDYEAHNDEEYNGVDKDGKPKLVKDDYTYVSFGTMFTGRIQFNMKDVINAEVLYKNPNSKTHVIGLYVMPKMVPGLDLNIGGAIEIGGEGGYGGAPTNKIDVADAVAKKNAGHTKSYADDYVNWNVDLRARYAINKQFSVFTFNKIYGTNLDAGWKAQKGLAGLGGGNGVFTKYAYKMGLWDMVGVRYALNDTFAFLLNGALEVVLDGDTEDANGNEFEFSCLDWRVTPGVQIYAAKSASITVMCAISGEAGAEYKDKTKNTKVENDTISVAIPVVFRVKL